MENKPLVIDVLPSAMPPTGENNRWSEMSNMAIFIRDIKTQSLHKDADMGAVVSGIPTPYARIDLFKNAIDRTGTVVNASSGDGLNAYYAELVKEWRGFLACIALDYPKISVKHVNLSYHDGKDISETSNIYEPLGAFGNMLLDRRALWCEQGGPSNEKKSPFIDIIKYDGQVVGATSPETFVFTSVGYHVDKKAPWVNVENGKFIDPLVSEMNQDQAITLYAYVRHILDNVGQMDSYFEKLPDNVRPVYNNINMNLAKWLEEIEAYVKSRGYNLAAGSIPPVDAGFDVPFSQILNYKDVLYGLEGSLYEDDEMENAIPFDPKKLLLSKEAEIARLHLGAQLRNDPSGLSKLPVYVLKARNKADDTYAYFALPLSPLGMNVFGKNIGALVGMADSGVQLRSSLTAEYDPNVAENNLEVTLNLVMTSGKTRPMKEAYTVHNEGIKNKDLIVWPNFISKQWDRYYMFSEMPHNVSSTGYPYRAMPFVGDENDEFFRILTNESMEPVYLAQDGVVCTNKRLDAKLLVQADNRVADNGFKYEIYESNRPFKGVRLVTPTKKEGGFLIINYTGEAKPGLPVNWLNTNRNLQEVNLGVDFGSTNTSVAYCNNIDKELSGFRFENMRVNLLGGENPDDEVVKKENELFFFPKKPLQSNAIKSMLTLHDPRRLKITSDEGTEAGMLAVEVKGGIPCFANNLPITEVTDSEIHLNFPGCGNVTIIHNMKWSDQEVDKSHKEAFLRTLLLQTYASLFQKGFVPTSLKWSYPSSMNDTLILQYQQIWNQLTKVRPVLKRSGLQMPGVDSHYELQISSKNLMLDEDTLNGGAAWGCDDNIAASGSGWGSGFSDSSAPVAQNDGWGAPASNGWGAPEPVAATGGWGSSQEQNDGWGAPDTKPAANRIPDLRPDDPQRRTTFAPRLMVNGNDDNVSLTEAASVANFLMNSKNYRTSTNGVLTVCFDIGGSTTDISALYPLVDGVTMIKQNSIRFAAQRVASATRFSPNFGNVLVKACAQFGIKILGLNMGPNQFSPQTAPYYFEQMVDRLPTDKLPEFYALIIANCPELMCVNLYVTGLVMYYAGQLTGKLVDELRRGTDTGMMRAPMVEIVFAGKGSRLFEWFSTTNPQAAENYYSQLFIRGMGGMQQAQKLLCAPPRINLSSQSSDDVKYEVSKGLANTNSKLLVPTQNEAIEILGENDFTITMRDGKTVTLAHDNSITAEMMSYIGQYFNAPLVYENPNANKFMDFASVFYNVASKYFGLKVPQSVFIDGFRNMNIDSYIRNMPEYAAAVRKMRVNPEKKFDFVAPIIVLEGMKFFEDYLLPAIKKQ